MASINRSEKYCINQRSWPLGFCAYEQLFSAVWKSQTRGDMVTHVTNKMLEREEILEITHADSIDA